LSHHTTTAPATGAQDVASEDPDRFEALRLDQDGPVWRITFTRPALLNRFDDVLHREFVRSLEIIRESAGVRAVVLASEGKVFSAGGDFELIRAANRQPALRRAMVEDARRLLGTLIDLPQPVVAAVQGAAMGLGATVALACDAVVASRNAVLADTHVNIGLVAGDGGALVWPAAAGMLRARRHLLTGDPLDAETAFTLGMVTDLVEMPEEVVAAADALAARIAALPPLAVQSTKRALNRVVQQRAGEVLDLSLALEEATLASEDVIEGIDAFLEKRPGRYSGS
jgi:enoyl-CoA hydratase